MADLQEGGSCPLCGGMLEFKPDGICECDSLNRHCPGYGPCKACEGAQLFCAKCDLFEDEIEEQLSRRVLRKPEQVAPAAAEPKASPLHRQPPSTAVLQGHLLWMPGIGGKV